FRYHDDIVADQLHHYYAQATARAVPGRLGYVYLNVLDDSFLPVFNGFAQKRDRDAMCVNDAPVPGATPIDDGFVQRFLDDFFPAPSQFERRGRRAREPSAPCHAHVRDTPPERTRPRPHAPAERP